MEAARCRIRMCVPSGVVLETVVLSIVPISATRLPHSRIVAVVSVVVAVGTPLASQHALNAARRQVIWRSCRDIRFLFYCVQPTIDMFHPFAWTDASFTDGLAACATYKALACSIAGMLRLGRRSPSFFVDVFQPMRRPSSLLCLKVRI